VSLDTAAPLEAALTGAAPAGTLKPAPRLVLPGRLQQAAGFGVDLLLMLGIIFCIPFVILGLGIPIALGLRLLLWITGML
jgi:hypothetical protein